MKLRIRNVFSPKSLPTVKFNYSIKTQPTVLCGQYNYELYCSICYTVERVIFSRENFSPNSPLGLGGENLTSKILRELNLLQ